MLKVAFLANEFPSPVERYVTDEIEELERRGVRVIAGSVRRPSQLDQRIPEIVLQRIEARVLVRAIWLLVGHWRRIAPLLRCIAFPGSEGLLQRVKALAHTFLGACYAAKLGSRKVDHIHVHHGYFGSWIAMTASRLLGVPFSMSLHGSDLLRHGVYLETKLRECAFCITVSGYNRRYILEHYPRIHPEKLLVVRVGADVPEHATPVPTHARRDDDPLILVTVGRLHPVKDHAFLVRACAELQARHFAFECLIGGEGPERLSLESLIQECGLEKYIHLLGHVSPEGRDTLYDLADAVVLTSRSEGIPVVLMEAMARGKLVVAPAITGIPELVIPGKTGFLYEPGSMRDFVECLMFIRSQLEGGPTRQLEWIRHGARAHVRQKFNCAKNTKLFADSLLRRMAPQTESGLDESLVLQQI